MRSQNQEGRFLKNRNDPPFLLRIRHRLMRTASWLPYSLLLKIDHLNWWKRDESEFSFWTDAHYWQYVRQDKKKATGIIRGGEIAFDEDGREYGPTQGELEKVLGAAAFAALNAFLKSHGLSVVKLTDKQQEEKENDQV